MKILDKDGNEVEVVTQEELDQKLQEKDEANKQAIEEAQKKATEDFQAQQTPNEDGKKEDGDGKKEESPKEDPSKEGGDKTLEDRLNALEETNRVLNESFVNSNKQRALSNLNISDEETKQQVEQRMQNLTGYEMTEQGIEQQAKDAYTLVTGQAPEASGVDMSGMASTHDKNTGADKNSNDTETDKGIQSALGITEEMAEKYKGRSQEGNSNNNQQ